MKLPALCLSFLLLFALIDGSLSAAEPMDGLLLDAADPTLVATPEGDYYVVCTGRGLPLLHSNDLLHWERVARVFPRNVPDWARRIVPKASSIWAPDITYRDGLYHVYYSVSSWGSQHSVIGLAVNKTLDPKSPDYAWSDRGLVVESDPAKTDFNAIDPALFTDTDGQPWLVWGSYWTGIKLIRIDSATGKPVEGEKPLPIAARSGNTTAIEGAFLIRHGDYYYLFTSWDACCDGERSTYNVRVGRSKEITGPYVDFQGRKLLEGGGTLVLGNHDRWRGPGHNGILQTPLGDWMVHHTYDTEHLDHNRVLQIRPMYWDEAGWPVVGEPLTQDLLDARANPGVLNVVGRWHHTVDYGGDTVIELLEGGDIRGDRGQTGHWTLDGDRLALTWDAAADGTVFIDRVTVEPTGKSYIGRNQNGQIIRGVQ